MQHCLLNSLRSGRQFFEDVQRCFLVVVMFLWAVFLFFGEPNARDATFYFMEDSFQEYAFFPTGCTYFVLTSAPGGSGF